jgi:KDO2-lipid IV(A) lauroyltransferase
MNSGHENSTPDPDSVPLYRFWQPRYWPGWIALAALRLICVLPYRFQLMCGRGLGRLMLRLLSRRRHIALRNLELCFPDWPAENRSRLLRQHFESLGIWVFEMGMSIWASDRRISRLTRVEGLEHITDALEGGRGVIAFSGHMTTIEITARAMGNVAPPFAAMYRPGKNPLFSEIVRRARARSTAVLISKSALRQMLRCLRNNMPVWYAADQSFSRKTSVLIPFFGEPAMTNAALPDIARISGAAVVGYLPRRNPDGTGYTIEIVPVLENFPGPDPAADMQRVAEILEAHIRRAPEQYYWVHRRFKGRPEPYEDPYSSGDGSQPATSA